MDSSVDEEVFRSSRILPNVEYFFVTNGNGFADAKVFSLCIKSSCLLPSRIRKIRKYPSAKLQVVLDSGGPRFPPGIWAGIGLA